MKLIDKDALVAEIKRQILAIDNMPKITDTQISVLSGNKVILTKLLSFIDTLESKEVDLKKEIENEIDEYWYDNDYGAIQRRGGTITMEVSDVKEIAKHFFEFGMQVSNKARKENNYV